MTTLPTKPLELRPFNPLHSPVRRVETIDSGGAETPTNTDANPTRLPKKRKANNVSGTKPKKAKKTDGEESDMSDIDEVSAAKTSGGGAKAMIYEKAKKTEYDEKQVSASVVAQFIRDANIRIPSHCTRVCLRFVSDGCSVSCS